ncbi:WD repeat-containing protein 44 [Juglans microcarpa x Juglans regia]|uniref:WD repeat-containing protein 44 n=1 Tax=Juglans microcarpa x Juglans regia TaxID=2249226 RepID=UPI001B7F602E|nr:WD repeat-containing protein 44 [Juglans microcarpa x Juglans regia]
MEPKRTMTMNWDGLGDDGDEDADRFLESNDRISSAVSLDLASSSDDEDFDETRTSFASAVSSLRSAKFRNSIISDSAAPDLNYDIWMATPGSINERRKRLLQGMGLATTGITRKTSLALNVLDQLKQVEPLHSHSRSPSPSDTPSPSPSHLPIVLVRSRSDGDIEMLSIPKRRKEDLIGKTSKQRLTRTYSMILAQHARICPTYLDAIRISPKEAGQVSSRQPIRHSGTLSQSCFGAFFLIKNLDTGKEFIVSEYGEDGMWNKLSDLQTGKKLTMEEFEKCVGYSPVVKELMRRENVSSRNLNSIDGNEIDRKVGVNSYFSKSLRMSKKGGAALLKNVKGLANSMSGVLIGEKEREISQLPSAPVLEQKLGKNSNSSKWIKAQQSGKSCKELSALHLCQEIQAHEGSIWTIKFSHDARFLASAGEDRVIHVWEVQECEVMPVRLGEEIGYTTPLHHSLSASGERPNPTLGEAMSLPSEKKKKGKSSSRKGNSIPDYVHVPESMFSLLEKPVCSFQGHQDDVLDLSWSKSQLLLSSSMDKTVRLWDLETKSCLKLFAHKDYVTCIQFNPIDDTYFISGSLDAKVRIWSVPDRQVVDWIDFHEMVTAASYTPDGQGAIIGSHKGTIRTYSTEGCKLDQISQIDIQTKKKSQAKKITGFQFAPGNPSEVLVTSADSRIRVLAASDVTHKFRGFRNTSSQIAASFCQRGKYIISASEDSQVYVWKHEEPRNGSGMGKNKSLITTHSHEHFQCKDVSVAIPWLGTIKGEPQAMPTQSKRQSKRYPTQPTSINGSPTREDNLIANSKRQLPPLPKKSTNNNNLESASTPQEDVGLALVSQTDQSGIGESFNSVSSSGRYGDSPSILTARNPSASSSSWSSSRSWFDVGNNHVAHTIQPTAWGLVIVTASLGGEIRAYQNFGLPHRIGRQTNLFGSPT